MTSLLAFLTGRCRHTEVIRERRTLVVDGEMVENVPHYVCPTCGWMRPIVVRSAEEHRRAQQVGAIVIQRAQPRRE